MSIESYLLDQGYWAETTPTGFLLCVDDPYGEPETRNPADGHTAHVHQEEDGTVVLTTADIAGYGERFHLPTVAEFARWWDAAMADGFGELHWDDYEFLD